MRSPLGDVRTPPSDGDGVFSWAPGMILMGVHAVLIHELCHRLDTL